MNDYIDQLTAMHMAKAHGHTSPHKAVMLLSVIDLIASGDASDNRFRLSPELMEHFRRYFDAVKTDADSCTPLNPYFYMRSESFWHHRATPGNEALCEALSSPGGRKKLGEIIDYAFLDNALFGLLKDGSKRAEIREAVIARYKADSQVDAVLSKSGNEEQVPLHDLYRRLLRKKGWRAVPKHTLRAIYDSLLNLVPMSRGELMEAVLLDVDGSTTSTDVSKAMSIFWKSHLFSFEHGDSSNDGDQNIEKIMKISTCEDMFRCVDLSLLSRLVNGIKSAEYKLDHEVLRGFLYGEYSDRELASLVDEAAHNATGQKLVDPQE